MKRLEKVPLILMILMLISGWNVQAQKSSPHKFNIDTYAGFPNGDYLNVITRGPGYTLQGFPFSFGARMEYWAANNFSIGVDGNFVRGGYKQTMESSYYVNSNGENSWEETSIRNRYRIMGRFAYHFARFPRREKLDAYVGLGLGYKWSTVSLKSTHEAGVLDSQRERSEEVFKPLIFEELLNPMIGRAFLGWRFYFNDVLSANLELGLGGGAIVQFGIGARF